MKEDFLHYLWKFQKLPATGLYTTSGKRIHIFKPGAHNHDSGPDFSMGEIIIEDQKWAGQIEIHLKSSDWYSHGHDTDIAYDNVILHVVWEHNREVFRKNDTLIETLELKHLIPSKYLSNYEKLFSSLPRWILCEHEIGGVEPFVIQYWLERLFISRLERKALEVNRILSQLQNDWEATFFILLCKHFGMKLNGETFQNIAESIPFSLIRKISADSMEFEALLMGQAGLLNRDAEDRYLIQLQVAYAYLQVKYPDVTGASLRPKFFRLRPANFPTIRLSQFVILWHRIPSFFSKMVECSSVQEFYELFEGRASDYWTTHYNFGKVTKPSVKNLSKEFIDHLIINVVLPLKFSYAEFKGISVSEELISLASAINGEQNSIVKKYRDLISIENDALTSQALLELYAHYCKTNNCLQCAIGNAILNKK